MVSCNCGGKTVKIKPGKVKKHHPKKVTIKKKSVHDAKRSAALSRAATRKATKAAKAKAKGCNCS